MIRSLRTKLALSHVVPAILLLPILSLYLLYTLEDFYIHGLIRQLRYQAELMRDDIEHESVPVTDIPSALFAVGAAVILAKRWLPAAAVVLGAGLLSWLLGV